MRENDMTGIRILWENQDSSEEGDSIADQEAVNRDAETEKIKDLEQRLAAAALQIQHLQGQLGEQRDGQLTEIEDLHTM
ncbi:hypothetical protein PG994_003119 [Apiospora phragmitis]|uniref:Uncharacterized protein n=1 Tax=Apiospora phragmitis TaxID=2905665 RepID=A0ABR1W8D7_9PEZI